MSGEYRGPERRVEAVRYTAEDRRLLRELHDALVGTITAKGLLRIVEDHLKWDHEDPRAIAKDEIGKHLERAGHVAERRDDQYGWNWRRWGFGLSQGLALAVTLGIGAWIVGVFVLGLQITIWQTAP